MTEDGLSRKEVSKASVWTPEEPLLAFPDFLHAFHSEQTIIRMGANRCRYAQRISDRARANAYEKNITQLGELVELAAEYPNEFVLLTTKGHPKPGGYKEIYLQSTDPEVPHIVVFAASRVDKAYVHVFRAQWEQQDIVPLGGVSLHRVMNKESPNARRGNVRAKSGIEISCLEFPQGHAQRSPLPGLVPADLLDEYYHLYDAIGEVQAQLRQR